MKHEKKELLFQEDYFFTQKKDDKVLWRDIYFSQDSKSLLLNMKTPAIICPKTDSDHYADITWHDMTSLCPVYSSETHIKPHYGIWAFLAQQQECSCSFSLT